MQSRNPACEQRSARDPGLAIPPPLASDGRCDALDWLRGLLACTIMLYHLTSWEFSVWDSGTLIGRLGIYAVSMFFVLSGLSMAIAYQGRIATLADAARFMVRRIFRIWPLLWICITIVTLGKVVLHLDPEWWLVLLNATTLFGFLAPDAYINTGAWSIGNEMVYYAMTPFLLHASAKGGMMAWSSLGISLLLGAAIPSWCLDADRPLAEQWAIYIHPFNNLYFYVSGIVLYQVFRRIDVPVWCCVTIAAISLALLTWYPVQGDHIRIVTGFIRVVYSVSCVALVFVAYRLRLALPRPLQGALTTLGLATYGVYLLHPVIYQVVTRAFRAAGYLPPAMLMIMVTIIITVVSAVALYRWFEVPLIRLGKRLSSP